MSANPKDKGIETDWSLKDLNETERNNLLGFFALLLKVDKRVNPQLYKNGPNRDTNNTNQAK